MARPRIFNAHQVEVYGRRPTEKDADWFACFGSRIAPVEDIIAFTLEHSTKRVFRVGVKTLVEDHGYSKKQARKMIAEAKAEKDQETLSYE